MRSRRPVLSWPAWPRVVRPRPARRRPATDDQRTAAATAIVALPPEIDIANADEVCDLLCAALQPGVGVLVADLTRATFCDARGVRALFRARDEAAAAGVELRLAVSPGRVRTVLNLINSDGRLPMYRTASRAAQPPGRPASL
jgi:anti-anti-sigma factor